MILNCEINEEEVTAAVIKLKNVRAAGCDLIVNEHISNTMSIFKSVFKKFFKHDF